MIAKAWNHLKEGLVMFHQEMYRGWKASKTYSRVVDLLLVSVGIFLVVVERSSTAVGYLLLVLLVVGQGWIINSLHRDLRSSHNAFLTVLHLLHEARKGKKNEDSGS